MTENQKLLQKDARELARFVRQHYPAARGFGRGVVFAWARWHLCEGDVVTVRDAANRSRRLVGVMVGRPVMRAKDGFSNLYARDPEGRVIFVDLVIARAPLVLRGLSLLLVRRFGRREQVAFRHRSGSRLRVYPLAAMETRVHRHWQTV